MSCLNVRHVVQSLPVPVLLLDKDKNLVDCNQAAYAVQRGVLLDDLLRIKTVDEALEKASAGEYSSVEVDTGKKWLRLNINPVYNDEGRQIGIAIFEKDITAKKAMINHLKSLRGVVQ